MSLVASMSRNDITSFFIAEKVSHANGTFSVLPVAGHLGWFHNFATVTMLHWTLSSRITVTQQTSQVFGQTPRNSVTCTTAFHLFIYLLINVGLCPTTFACYEDCYNEHQCANTWPSFCFQFLEVYVSTCAKNAKLFYMVTVFPYPLVKHDSILYILTNIYYFPFLMIHNLMDVKWNFTVVLIYISLMVDYNKHLSFQELTGQMYIIFENRFI